MHDHTEQTSQMSFSEKLKKLIEHWSRHNEEHAATYNKWAVEAAENNMKPVSQYIKEAAELTLKINMLLSKADNHIQL